ncbi:MAG: chorismate mutase, partial [Balneolaceae bacterium]
MGDKDPLNSIREAIDKLDQTIVQALGERQKIVQKVISDKLQSSKEIRDPDREEAVLQRIRTLASDSGIDPYFMEQLFREIIHHSVRYQTHVLLDKQNKKTKESAISVAFQG